MRYLVITLPLFLLAACAWHPEVDWDAVRKLEEAKITETKEQAEPGPSARETDVELSEVLKRRAIEMRAQPDTLEFQYLDEGTRIAVALDRRSPMSWPSSERVPIDLTIRSHRYDEPLKLALALDGDRWVTKPHHVPSSHVSMLLLHAPRAYPTLWPIPIRLYLYPGQATFTASAVNGVEVDRILLTIPREGGEIEVVLGSRNSEPGADFQGR